MKLNRNFLSLYLATFLVVLVCSCSKSSGTSTPPTSASNSVSIAGMAFGPSTLTVKVGTIVTWKNNDGITHTVTSNDGTSFSSGNLASGASFSFTTTTTGTFAYHCTIHPGMVGSLVVTQ
jgi:plastocyanin